MRLTEAYVDNFGVLHRVRVSFQHEMTVILANNGSGKSTFAAFVQAMLYGLQGNTRKELTENDRKRYLPWQGGTFGGWIQVETDSLRLRIARTFGLRPKEDTLYLTDLHTGREIPEPEEGVGRWICGLDADTFIRCLYLPQRETLPSFSSISTQLRAMLAGSDDPEAFSAAIQQLENTRKELQPLRGNGGTIGRLMQRLDALNAQWQAQALSKETIARCHREAEDACNTLAQLDAKRNRLQEQLAVIQHTQGERTALQRQLEEGVAFFQGHVPSPEEIAALEESVHQWILSEKSEISSQLLPDEAACTATEQFLDEIDRLDREMAVHAVSPQLRQEGQQLEQFFRKGLPTATQATQWQTQFNQWEKIEKVRIRCLLSGILLLFMGIVVGSICTFVPALAYNLIAGWLIAGGTVGGGALLCGLGWLAHRKCKKYQTQFSPLQQKYAPEQSIRAALGLVLRNRAKWDCIRTELLQIRDIRAKQATQRTALQQAVDAFFQQYGHPEPTDRASLAFLRQKKCADRHRDTSAEKEAVWAQFQRICGKTPQPETVEGDLRRIRLVYDQIARVKENLAVYSSDEQEITIKSQMSVTDTEVQSQQLRYFQAKQRVEDLQKQLQELDELQCHRTELLEQLHEAEHKRDLLDRTISLLRQAQDQLSGDYFKPLQSRFLSYFTQVFSSDAMDLHVNPELQLLWTQQGGERPLSTFSIGTQACADLCMRLALADLLFGKERPFFILDDPFVHLDGQRLQQVLSLLKKISTNTQIIYFTCHPSRAEGLTTPIEMC